MDSQPLDHQESPSCAPFNEVLLEVSPLKLKALVTIINLLHHLTVLAKQMGVISFSEEDHAVGGGMPVMDTDAYGHD